MGGQAAAAHSLGTPLATISVIASELKKEMGENSEYKNDLDLLVSQTKRCNDEILRQISRKEIIEDKFFSSSIIESLLNEIIENFQISSEKIITLFNSEDNNKIEIKRSPEIIYGLNFIGNAVKFAKKNIFITIKSDQKKLSFL